MKYYRILIVLIASSILVSCSGQNNSTLNSWVKPQVNLLTLNEIAVFPFNASSDYPKQVMSEQDIAAINNKLVNVLKLNTSTNVADCKTMPSSNGTLLEKAANYGSSCNAQAVLYGVVSKYGKDKSAAFTLWLYSFKHRAVVWSASYENSQPVLTDNLLGMGGQSFKYRSSEENLFSGFRQVARELESKRLSKNNY